MRKRLEQLIESAEYRGAEEWARDALRDNPEPLEGWTVDELAPWRRQQLLEPVIGKARTEYTRAAAGRKQNPGE